MIVRNYTKRGGTASFKSSIDRSSTGGLLKKQNNLAPPIGHYDYDIVKLQGKTKNKDLDL